MPPVLSLLAVQLMLSLPNFAAPQTLFRSANARGAPAAASALLDLEVFYLTMDTDMGFTRRESLRVSSLPLIDHAAFRVRHKFVFSGSQSSPPSAQLLAENATHGDLFLAPSWVEQRDLSSKVWLEMRDVAQRNATKAWFKVDDDVFIRFDLLLPELALLPETGLLWCRRGHGMFHTNGIKSPYCNGCYVMSMDVVAKVANASVAAICGYNEDVCISGMATQLRAAPNFRDDLAWHADDEGEENECLW